MNQLGRRNLNDFQRIEIVRKCENAVKAQAKEKQSSGINQYTNRSVEKLPPTSDLVKTEKDENSSEIKSENQKEKSRDTLGVMAGVSGKTYEHALTIG